MLHVYYSLPASLSLYIFPRHHLVICILPLNPYSIRPPRLINVFSLLFHYYFLLPSSPPLIRCLPLPSSLCIIKLSYRGLYSLFSLMKIWNHFRSSLFPLLTVRVEISFSVEKLYIKNTNREL